MVSRKGRTVYAEVGVWWGEKTQAIHLAPPKSKASEVETFHVAVRPEPEKPSGHPYLSRELDSASGSWARRLRGRKERARPSACRSFRKESRPARPRLRNESNSETGPDPVSPDWADSARFLLSYKLLEAEL